MRVTETLEARTQALQEQLNSQRNDFAQKLFEAQQDVSKVQHSHLNSWQFDSPRGSTVEVFASASMSMVCEGSPLLLDLRRDCID